MEEKANTIQDKETVTNGVETPEPEPWWGSEVLPAPQFTEPERRAGEAVYKFIASNHSLMSSDEQEVFYWAEQAGMPDDMLIELLKKSEYKDKRKMYEDYMEAHGMEPVPEWTDPPMVEEFNNLMELLDETYGTTALPWGPTGDTLDGYEEKTIPLDEWIDRYIRNYRGGNTQQDK